MIAPLSEWTHRGKFIRLSPCGRFKIQLAMVAGERAYYPYPARGGAKFGGPFETSAEAWACCAEADARAAA